MSEWLVKGSFLLNVTLIVTILTIWYPQTLQNAANTVFYFISDPTQRLWSLYGLVVGMVALLGILIVRDIKVGAVSAMV